MWEIVCLHCQKMTKVPSEYKEGGYCAHCGNRLGGVDEAQAEVTGGGYSSPHLVDLGRVEAGLAPSGGDDSHLPSGVPVRGVIPRLLDKLAELHPEVPDDE